LFGAGTPARKTTAFAGGGDVLVDGDAEALLLKPSASTTLQKGSVVGCRSFGL
jgi:hypothetical protein